MADWFVRPNTSHSGTRDGTSYATAWGGWTEIVWGGAGVIAGDTLYVCDSHSYGAILAIGAHGATSGSRVTIRGDYAGHPGSITFTAGDFYIDANRNYTTITALTVNAGTYACISPGGTPLIGLTVSNCTFSAGSAPQAPIRFRPLNGWSYQDIVINGNSFSGGAGTNEGGSAIQWYHTATWVSAVSGLQIYDNTFTGCLSQRAVILLKAKNEAGVGTKLSDIIIRDNTFTDCHAVVVEAYGPETYGVHAGIRIYNNTITNQSQVGILGGGFALGGFGPSTTPGFGTNDIYNNWCSGLHGLTGFCNPMYGTYRIFNNYAENITTTDIDGCGVLFDHECKDSVAFCNEFRDIHGKGASDNFDSGFGILVLDATNCTAYGNLIVNCLTGVAFGNKNAGQSSDIYNNTFVNCSKAGAYLVGGADNTTNIVRNNIFTTTDNTIPFAKVNSIAWTGESSNCFYGFGASPSHTLAASTVTSDPELDGAYRPRGAAVKRTGLYLGGKDVYGKHFYDPPNMGAVDDHPTPAWSTAADPV